MDQMDLFSIGEQSWIDKVQAIIDKIIKNEDLPENSLRIVENLSRDKQEVTSYSISVVKPDYPRGLNRNGVSASSLFNIQEKKKTVNKAAVKTGEIMFCISDSLAGRIKEHFQNVELVKRQSDVFTRVVITVEDPYLDEIAECVINESLDDFFRSGGNSFGCCHLYEECSDVGKCLHENRLYAKGCAYYHNLSAGRIFYGKNRNV